MPPSKFRNSVINQSLISEGCIINAKEIKSSVIGIRSRIGSGTVLENCYVMGNDFYQDLDELHEDTQNNKIHVGIGENCFIKNVLVDKNVRIGNNVHINGGKHLDNFTNELYTIKDGIVVIKKGVVLSDNFRIE